MNNPDRTMNRSPSNRDGESTLVPRGAPGRRTRKARAFAAEIGRLYALDYTLEAIREALADAGVSVSTSTVWREAVRHRARLNAATSDTARPDPSERRIAGNTSTANVLDRREAQR